MQPSKAAQIPPELFEHLLWHVVATLHDREAIGHISACSLVCRYWARLARRHLFEDITLRTPNCAKGLREILEAPALPGLEHIAGMIRRITATPDDKDESWLHLLFLAFAPKLPNLGLLDVRLALQADGKTWTTLHPSLPRAVPGSLMQINQLRLTGLHFPTRRAVSRLLLSIPFLRYFQSFKLTFDAEPGPEDFFPSSSHRHISEIMSDDIQLCLSVVPVLIADLCIGDSAIKSSNRRRPRDIMNEDDMQVLRDLLGTFDKASIFMLGGRSNGEPKLRRSSVSI